MDKQIIIDDQKKTIHRLQDECTEKTNAIIALGDQLQAKEQECETLASQLDFEVQKKECLEQESRRLKLDLIEAKAHGDYLNNLALSKTLDTVSSELDQLKLEKEEIKKYLGISHKTILERLEELTEFRDKDRNEIWQLQQQLDQFKAERDKIKTICDNHFDEYEMGCLDLSDAIESLLERYDNAITGLTKQRKELKAENDLLRQHKKSKQASYESMQQQWNEFKLENRRLKAENEKLKQYKEVVDKLAGMQIILTNEEKMPMLYENAKDLKLKQLSQTLTDIKEIALKSDMPPCLDIDCECEYCKDSVTNKGFNCMQYGLEQILQKISEVKE